MRSLCLAFVLTAAFPSAASAAGGRALPAAVRAIDVGMAYIDPELRPRSLPVVAGQSVSGGFPPQLGSLARDLQEGLEAYRERWAVLPQIEIPSGPALRRGAAGERVRLLRRRLGLEPDGGFDAVLGEKVSEYRRAHGLGPGPIAGPETIASLNRGAGHYERLILANLARAAALPADPGRRYILVDAAAALLWLYEDGEAVDSMRVIVGKPSEPTPMLAGMIRYAMINPYWNIPPDLVRERVARGVLAEGPSYLRARNYEILSDWTDEARTIAPDEVDWDAVAAGRQELRVRQLPGAANAMGEIKFMFPNRFGVYLHDTPDRSLFRDSERRFSSGCVRLEDARRLARWMFGAMPRAASNREERVDLAEPVPVYITYLTAASSGDGIVFRDDAYNRDGPLLAQLESPGPESTGPASGRQMTAARR